MKKSLVGLLLLALPSPVLAYAPPPPALDAAITQVATEYGIDVELAKSIAWCENHGYKETAKHWNTNGTKDVGIFQINDIHIPELERRGLTRYDAAENIEFAMILMARNGTRDFLGSASCWRPLYSGL